MSVNGSTLKAQGLMHALSLNKSLCRPGPRGCGSVVKKTAAIAAVFLHDHFNFLNLKLFSRMHYTKPLQQQACLGRLHRRPLRLTCLRITGSYCNFGRRHTWQTLPYRQWWQQLCSLRQRPVARFHRLGLARWLVAQGTEWLSQLLSK